MGLSLDLRMGWSDEDLRELSFHQLTEISKRACKIREEKYGRSSKRPQYGTLRRSLRASELRSIFETMRNPAARCAFLTVLMFGLRISELRTIEYWPENRAVRILNEKTDRPPDFMPVVDPLVPMLEHLSDYQRLSPDYLRKVWRAVRSEIPSLDRSYGSARDGRPLYQFGTHSLRHTAVSEFARIVGGDPYRVARFSRHAVEHSIGVQAVYRSYEWEEFERDVRVAFTAPAELFMRLYVNETAAFSSETRQNRI